MAEVNVSVKITGCKDCPRLTTGTDFGNDGRDGVRVYICTEGAFGSKGGGYCGADYGPTIRPRVPPIGCPYIKASALERLASRLLISTETLRHALEQEQIKIE